MKNSILLVGVMLALTTNVFACTCGDYNASFNSVTPFDTGQYNWSYTICRNGVPAPINYVMIGTGICNGASIGSCISSFGVQSNPYAQLTYTSDSSTGITGLKFYNLSDTDGCKTFWFAVNQNYDSINSNAGIRTIEIANLACNYTVKTPKQPTVPAPEFPSVAVPLIIAVGAVSVAYKMRKTS